MRRIEERIERRRILAEAVAELCTVELKRADVLIYLRTRGELRAVELRLHARNAGAAPFQLSELSGLANVVEPILPLLLTQPRGELRMLAQLFGKFIVQERVQARVLRLRHNCRRSEERREGKEGVGTCISRGS